MTSLVPRRTIMGWENRRDQRSRGEGIRDAELAKLRLKRRLRWISLKFTGVTQAGLDAFLREHPRTRVATFEGITTP